MKKNSCIIILFVSLLMISITIYNQSKTNYTEAYNTIVGSWTSDDGNMTLSFNADDKTGNRRLYENGIEKVEQFEYQFHNHHIILTFRQEGNFKEEYSIGLSRNYLFLEQNNVQYRFNRQS